MNRVHRSWPLAPIAVSLTIASVVLAARYSSSFSRVKNRLLHSTKSARPCLDGLPPELLLLISLHLSVYDLCSLCQVSRYLKRHVDAASVWTQVFKDLRVAKPQPYHRDVYGLTPQELKNLVAREILIEKRLSSATTPRSLWSKSCFDVTQAQFIPNTGGTFVVGFKSGRLELNSLDGVLLHSLDGADSSLTEMTFRVQAVSQHKCYIVQMFRHDDYMCWDSHGIVRVIDVTDQLMVVATYYTKTRPISASVCKDAFAVLLGKKESIFLHVLAIPPSSFSSPATRSCFEIDGFGKDYDHGVLRGATIRFLDEEHILFGNRGGLFAYALSAESVVDEDKPTSPSEPRLPYWSTTDYVQSYVNRSFKFRAEPDILVFPPTPEDRTMRCVLATGVYLHLIDVPRREWGSQIAEVNRQKPDPFILDYRRTSLGNTGGMLGITFAGYYYTSLVIRTGDCTFAQTRLSQPNLEWLQTGRLLVPTRGLRITSDFSLDDSEGYIVLIRTDKRRPQNGHTLEVFSIL